VPLAAAQVVWVGLAVVSSCLFVAVMVGLWSSARSRHGFGAAVAYLLAQSASSLMAAAYFPLYLAALAVHYVEYHVLMAPRCFRATLDPTSRIDRAYGAVRARPIVFYALVIMVAGLGSLSAAAGMGMM